MCRDSDLSAHIALNDDIGDPETYGVEIESALDDRYDDDDDVDTDNQVHLVPLASPFSLSDGKK